MVKNHLAKIPKRANDTHKRDFGHVLVIGGSKGMTGAAYLASHAAMLSGAGMVTCAIPESLNSIMEVKLTEEMTLPLPDIKAGSFSFKAAKKILEFSERVSVIALGPGLSRNKETLKFARYVIRKSDKPIVLDADGIISLEGHTDLLKKRKAVTVLTPHPGEMRALIGKSISVIQAARGKIAFNFAKKHNVIMVLKGHGTIVAHSKYGAYVNTTGNSGMSTAGAGDVLTGMISGFMAQGIEAYSASIIGVYLHGLAGDIAAKEKGEFSLIASDLLNKIPQAIQERT